MKKTLMTLGIALLMQAATSYGADDTYLAMKAGVFLPNGKSPGLEIVNTGYAVDLAMGVRPAPYAAIEFGTGFFSASGDSDAQGVPQEMTAYGVPVTLTAKGIMDFGNMDLFAGAGAGMYFCFINNKINVTDETKHGIAPGYQAVAGADYRINDRWNAGAEFKWFSARPELKIKNAANNEIEEKWEFGGTIVSFGVKYKF